MTNLRKLIVTMTYAFVCGSAHPRDEGGGGGGHGGSDAGDVRSDAVVNGFIPNFHECNDSCLVE